ncbi:SpoIVB peptidase S55 domain-containing protein [Natronospora cellulosivora (SeqCode)]
MKKLSFIFALIFLIIPIMTVEATEIMTLDEIEPGMKGVARTVFHAYEVEEFPLTIIDIVSQTGNSSDLILFKAEGKKIDDVGGIASGMSGSPVYIDGKLIGAIAYGWSLSDHRFAMIKPIEEMLKLLENPKQEAIENQLLDQLRTPIYLSGFTGRSLDRLKKEFEGLGFEVLQSGGVSRHNTETLPLEPGSAVAVQLARGDVNVASIGTLTYLDEDNHILAFGHSFLNKGDVEYILSRAYINTIIPSIQTPFKLGAASNDIIGIVDVDRGAGVAGRLDNFPRIIPLRVSVSDEERKIENTVNVQLVRDEDLLTSLITNISLQTIDSTLDRIGRGTANVNYKITAKGLPDFGIERSNVFYSRHDIAAVALYEVYRIINIITSNPFQEVNFIDIQLDIEIENEDRVALIQEAKVLNEIINPGDTVDIELTLLPYRSEPFSKMVSIELPDDVNTGIATLLIDGGLTGESYQMIPDQIAGQDETNRAIIEGYKDLDSIIEDFLERPKNNDLILKLYPGYSMPVYNYPTEETEELEEDENQENIQDEEELEIDKQDEDYIYAEDDSNNISEDIEALSKDSSDIRKVVSTDYVLEGSLIMDINIEAVEFEHHEENNEISSDDGEQ